MADQNIEPFRISLDSYRLLVQEVKDYAIFLLDLKGNVSSWNVGAERVKGYRAEEVLGKHFSLFYTEADQKSGKPQWNLNEALKEGRLEDEGWRIRKDGSRFWANVVITRIRNEQGKLVGFSKVTRDLTERKAAEERLKRSEAQLSIAQKIAHVGSWEWDLSTGALTWSDQLYRIYGLSPQAETLTYERYLALIHPDDRAFVKAAIEKAFQNRGAFSFSHRIIRPDGAVRFLHALGEVVLGDEGRPVRLFGTGQDITERKEAEDEIRKLNADLERRVTARTAELREANRALRQRTIEAEEATRLKSQFVSNVSHELRTPLNAILGYATLLKGETFGSLMAYQKQPIDGILRNGADLLHLIEEVLDLSRIEAGTLRVQIGPADLRAVIEEAISAVKPLIDQKSLSIDYKAEPDLPVLKSDAGKIKQIIVNLLSNAVKFTSQGGITLSGRDIPQKKGVELSVRDTGIGINSEALSKIFDAFYQLDAGLTRETGGIGLGLKIVKELTRLLQGEIRAESEVGKGSLFILFLPYRYSHP